MRQSENSQEPKEESPQDKKQKNALLPKLPFLKQGQMLSQFGIGYSRILARQ